MTLSDTPSFQPVETVRRGVIRLLAALGLTVVGYAWQMPYAGYTFSLTCFAPAAVLEFLAISSTRDRGVRLVGFVFSLLTAAGLVLGVVGAAEYVAAQPTRAAALLALVLIAAMLSLVAALMGRRRG